MSEQLLKAQEEILDKEPITLSAELSKVYNLIIGKIKNAKQQRDQNREEFDDLNYEHDYILNRRAVNTYLRPKKNDDEVRVNTPTTEKKIEGVLNELMALNLQPEVLAYDKEDNHLQELGEAFSDIVKRTNEMEQDDDKYIDAYLELLTQRAVFMEELWYDNKCEKHVLSGLQIYVGDINMPAHRFNKQPYIIKYERMNYDNAKEIYIKMDNWKYVSKGASANESDPFGYRMNNLRDEEVEIIHYMSYINNEYQCIINGVPMYEVNKKYTDVVGELNGYHITVSIPKPISADFFYGRSLVSSAKVIQSLDNETFRNIIRKFRQAIEPPLGTRSGKVFSRDIWNPGSVTQGVGAKDFELLISHQGVTAGEMGILNMIEQKTSEFVGAGSDISKKSRVTAKEVIAAQREAIKMMGLSMFAVMRLKRNLTFLRINNVLANYSKPIKKNVNSLTQKIENVYQKFSVSDAQLAGGKTGKKVVQFMDKTLGDGEIQDVIDWENKQSKGGEPTRFVGINIEKLKNTKIDWYVSVIQKERDSSELAKAMFQDKLNNVMLVSQIAGRPVSGDKIIEEAERLYQSKGLFEKAPMAQATMPGATMPGGNSTVAGELIKGETASNNKPSINTSIGGGASR